MRTRNFSQPSPLPGSDETVWSSSCIDETESWLRGSCLICKMTRLFYWPRAGWWGEIDGNVVAMILERRYMLEVSWSRHVLRNYSIHSTNYLVNVPLSHSLDGLKFCRVNGPQHFTYNRPCTTSISLIYARPDSNLMRTYFLKKCTDENAHPV